MTAQDREQLKALQTSIENQEKQINRILHYIENDDTTNQKGIIAKVEDVNNKIDGILVREKVYRAKATVWGMVGAVVISVMVAIVKFVVAKTF